jgi:hypothetical protein
MAGENNRRAIAGLPVHIMSAHQPCRSRLCAGGKGIRTVVSMLRDTQMEMDVQCIGKTAKMKELQRECDTMTRPRSRRQR